MDERWEKRSDARWLNDRINLKKSIKVEQGFGAWLKAGLQTVSRGLVVPLTGEVDGLKAAHVVGSKLINGSDAGGR